VIGVVVPTCNRWPWVQHTVASLLAQDTDLELAIVVVDDGSTDRTSERLRAWLARSFPHATRSTSQRSVAVYTQPRSGVSRARNVGLSALRELGCRYLTHQDDDDLALPWKLRLLQARLARDPTLGLVHSRIRDITTAGILLPGHSGYTSLLARRRPGGSLWGRARRGTFEPGALQHINYIHNAGIMVAASALDRLGTDELYPHGRDYGEDWELHKRLERAGVQIGFCDRVVALYRNNPAGLFMAGWEPRPPEAIVAQARSLPPQQAVTLLTFVAGRLPQGLRSLPRELQVFDALLGNLTTRLRVLQKRGRLVDAYAVANQLHTLSPTSASRRVSNQLRRQLIATVTRELDATARRETPSTRELALALYALAPTIAHGRRLAQCRTSTQRTR